MSHNDTEIVVSVYYSAYQHQVEVFDWVSTAVAVRKDTTTQTTFLENQVRGAGYICPHCLKRFHLSK